MCRLAIHVFITLLFTNFSCEKNGRNNYTKYNITIKEIDGNNNEIIISFKNVFISSKSGLFEYDFMFKSKSKMTIGSPMVTESKEDSVTVSFIPQGEPVYYKFDFTGNLLAKDSIKTKSNDFVKIDASNNKTDPLFAIISKLSEKDLYDTVFNNINFKTYKHPDVFKDTIGDMTLQIFFIKDTALKTPFNVNNRYPLVLNKYNLAGFAFNVLSANRKLISVISDIRELTAAETILCNEINKKKF